MLGLTSRQLPKPMPGSAVAILTVSSQVIELGQNRVNVVFTVKEGGRTKINQINFVGNNAIPTGGWRASSPPRNQPALLPRSQRRL